MVIVSIGFKRFFWGERVDWYRLEGVEGSVFMGGCFFVRCVV